MDDQTRPDAPLRDLPDRDTVRIALTRHGQTEWNAQNRFQGSSDVPLNDAGRMQAQESAGRFGEGEWDAIVSSPLARACETARIVAQLTGVPMRGTYADLIERDYGDAEGHDADAVHERWPDGDFPGLESRDAVAERGLRALDAIAADLPGRTVIAVAHGTIIRQILRTLTDAEIPTIENAATSVIEKTDGGWRIVTVNDRELSAT